MLRRFFQIFLFSLLILNLSPRDHLAAKQVQDFQLKAVYLYNFAHFVNFPPSDSASETVLTFCVVGAPNLRRALEYTLENQTIEGKTARIIELENSQASDQCQILYISKSQQQFIEQSLKRTEGMPILTVSDSNGFTNSGGIIEFIRKDNKIKLKINNQIAKAKGLMIKANLLNIATVVNN